MFANNARDTVQLRLLESIVVRQSDRFEPELREFVVPPHVDVNRFISVAGEKEKPVRAALQDSRTHLIGFCQVFELAPILVSGSG